MPKKPPLNGYYFFMLDFKRSAESRGRRFPGGMRQVAEAASDDWKALSQAQKNHYNNIAKEKKNDPRPNVEKSDEKKFNSQGVSFAAIKKEKAEAEEKQKQESNFIAQFVDNMGCDDLQNKLIYLIHVNIFCKTDDDVYYPAEIGIIKFSLKNGVKNVFHRYIDPGEIATGYSYAVKDHSDRTHKLTLKFVKTDSRNKNLDRLYHDICEFLTEDESNLGNEVPPLFTMYDDVFHNTSLNAVKKTLKHLWETVYPSDIPHDDQWERHFRVLPLPDMFYRLKNKCNSITNPGTVAFPNAVLPKLELQKDTYHYDVDTACKFHRDEDIIFHCSRSFVCRWAYIIRDHCTHLIGIDMFVENSIPDAKSEHDRYYDYDNNEGLVDSELLEKFSEASIGFTKANPRVTPAASLSGKSECSDKNVFANCSKRDIVENKFSVNERKGNGACSSASVAGEERTDFDHESEVNKSTKSCPAWPRVNRSIQNVPTMNENNFPSLGRGRGSMVSLRSKMNNGKSG